MKGSEANTQQLSSEVFQTLFGTESTGSTTSARILERAQEFKKKGDFLYTISQALSAMLFPEGGEYEACCMEGVDMPVDVRYCYTALPFWQVSMIFLTDGESYYQKFQVNQNPNQEITFKITFEESPGLLAKRNLGKACIVTDIPALLTPLKLSVSRSNKIPKDRFELESDPLLSNIVTSLLATRACLNFLGSKTEEKEIQSVFQLAIKLQNSFQTSIVTSVEVGIRELFDRFMHAASGSGLESTDSLPIVQAFDSTEIFSSNILPPGMILEKFVWRYVNDPFRFTVLRSNDQISRGFAFISDLTSEGKVVKPAYTAAENLLATLEESLRNDDDRLSNFSHILIVSTRS